jgi:ATP-dependent protease ClpP protease subunit
MPSYAEGSRFFINEFDESMDQMMLELVEAVYGKDKWLEFWINSEGGDASRAFSVVALMEVAKARGKQVYTYVLHDAHSSGSIVAVAGSKGHRKVAERGSYLLHYGQTDVVANGPVELQRIADANARHFLALHKHYRDCTKIDHPTLDEFLLHDNFYLPADRALELGFADEYM